jgi:phosphoribosylaminoimidazolecarboxamide formyltransferase/IMP cyclohydrolase
MIKRALISVSNKEGIVNFVKKLQSKKIEILSTGGTAELLRKNKIKTTDVSEYTGHPEIMGGRVKTLHPKIHGGLLALRGDKIHSQEAKKNKIKMIDLVVVNLYPFAETVKTGHALLEDAIEQIDIGGPSMLRSAAKNFKYVTVISDPDDYDAIWSEIKKKGNTTEETRRRLAEKVFALTAYYDSIIANYLSNGRLKHIALEKISDLRYGENPHQTASFYKDKNAHHEASLVSAQQLQGKELSYNNIMDADGALSLVREFSQPAVVFVKHANPCGVAVADNINQAHKLAYEGDVKSAFGGIIAYNRTCTKNLAKKIISHFFEVVIAPDFSKGAINVFKAKPRLRVLKVGKINPEPPADNYRKVSAGLLIQDLDTKQITAKDLKVVTKRQPTKQEIKDLLFAWQVIRHVKSNAIVLAKGGMAVGIGAGQQSRVDAVELAVKKSLGRARGSVMASDAFFPFPDSVEVAAANGIKAIIQPGGSIKDQEVIKVANKLGVAMVFTGVRAFLH